jgi:hypothetical protein
LWWNDNANFLNTPYGQRQNTQSERNVIARNRFTSEQVAISLTHTASTTLAQNAFTDCGENIHTNNSPDTVIQDSVPSFHPSFPSIPVVRGFNPRTSVSGSLDAFLPEGARRGRQYILVDEWGPYDFAQAKIWPSTLHAGASGTLYLYGPESAFTVMDVPDGISVEPLRGNISRTVATKLELRATRAGLQEFDIGVQIAAEDRILRASGTFLNTEWHIRFFHWESPKTHAKTRPHGMFCFKASLWMR